MSFKEVVVIVTGASRGIGRGIALGFGEVGASVVVNYHSRKEKADEVVDAIEAAGGKARSYKADTSDPAQVDAMVRFTEEQFGPVDVLVNNAGIPGPSTHMIDHTVEEWDRILAVNLRGYFLCCKAVLPSMLARKSGTIINIASIYGKHGEPNNAAYCASKGALEAMIRPLATDHAGVIRVVGVCPGTIDTPMLAASCAGWDTPKEELYAEVAQKIPVRRMGEPVDVAKAVAFLISDDAAYINAISLVLDGGTLALPPW